MAMIYSTSEHEASPGCCAYHDAQAKDAEIASLRAEVARLTEDVAARDESYRKKCEQSQALGTKLDAYAREVARLTEEATRDRNRIADSRDASRALADRLGEALDAIYCGDDDCASYECGIARAALREHEEARRGSEGGGRRG